MWQWIKKRLALFRYRTRLGPLLLVRYGRQRRYTPPQVLTTIKVHGLNEVYAAYACAMYCSKQAYSAFAAARAQHAAAARDAAAVDSTRTDPTWLLWSAAGLSLWPKHGDLVAELGHSYSGDDVGHGHTSSDASPDFDGHFGHDGSDGSGGDHGGHDGGGGDSAD
jgi:hypothetical protein